MDGASSSVPAELICTHVVTVLCDTVRCQKRMEEHTLVLQVLMNLFWTSEPS